jgi:phosphoribosylcarboxyaminoimidazole (NCAIR) mutase
MPVGVPDATVSINGGRNAAILACQIISLHNDNTKRKMHELKVSLSEEVKKQAANIKSKSKRTPSMILGSYTTCLRLQKKLPL